MGRGLGWGVRLAAASRHRSRGRAVMGGVWHREKNSGAKDAEYKQASKTSAKGTEERDAKLLCSGQLRIGEGRDADRLGGERWREKKSLLICWDGRESHRRRSYVKQAQRVPEKECTHARRRGMTRARPAGASRRPPAGTRAHSGRRAAEAASCPGSPRRSTQQAPGGSAAALLPPLGRRLLSAA